MEYKNRLRVELILIKIKELEKKICNTTVIRNSIGSEANIELRISSLGFTVGVSLTDTQVKLITNNIIEECNKKVEEYKEQLKYL